jgi:hypothetical protein
MTGRNLKTTTAFLILGVFLTCSLGCSRGDKTSLSTAEASSKAPDIQKENAEPKRQESEAVEPKVQAEIEKMEAEKPVSLLKDAQAALDETGKRARGAG